MIKKKKMNPIFSKEHEPDGRMMWSVLSSSIKPRIFVSFVFSSASARKLSIIERKKEGEKR